MIFVPFNITDKELEEDWKSLCRYKCEDSITPASTRPGLKLCYNFFPNFRDIKTTNNFSINQLLHSPNLKLTIAEEAYTKVVTDTLLVKALYSVSGLYKPHIFHPHIAKQICDKYKPNLVLDPCAGYGGRLLGCLAANTDYIGVDPLSSTINNYSDLLHYLKDESRVEKHPPIIIQGKAEDNIINLKVQPDMILTSPPPYDFEIYEESEDQAWYGFNNILTWKYDWLAPTIEYCIATLLADNGYSCWNVNSVFKDVLFDVHHDYGYELIDTFGLQTPNEDEIGDITYVFKKT